MVVQRRMIKFFMRDPSNHAFADAAAEAKRVIRHAGRGYNRHDNAALRSALSAAADQGSPRFLARWGAWDFRFDLSGGEGNPQLVEVQQRSGEPTSNVASLSLPQIPRQKLLAALEGHEATPVAMGTVVDEQKELGGVQLSRSAGAAASSSTQPTLIQAAEILKRELRLEGSLKDVVQQAAAQLGIEPGPPLTELAQQCLRELRPGMTQEV